MAVQQIINKINIMIINFIDNSFDIYKSDFDMQYTKCINHEHFVEFATHDFLFCTILHGEFGGKYDIREYHTSEFKILLNENLNAYARIVSIVDTYFKKHSQDACQKIEEYKPETILKYYTFVFVKLNETLFLRKHSPFAILDDSDTDFISDDECY
jgi:hypothetical protein